MTHRWVRFHCAHADRRHNDTKDKLTDSTVRSSSSS
eukprot:COSAG06_NODE_44294_length_364_cov_1.467925_1_plen_35_part_01